MQHHACLLVSGTTLTMMLSNYKNFLMVSHIVEPRTSHFVDSNDQRAVPCYDNLKLDEMVTIQRFYTVAPTLGPIMNFPSFSHFAPLPLLFPKCLHQCHYFFFFFLQIRGNGALVQTENREGKTHS